ncbi:HTH_Tnp_Tc3_2 domain-containing protein [Trichonephila clavipes]|nr:HTH_Tnp_Tc3_2 domain-containing protein [Trichonephila clavipes]
MSNHQCLCDGRRRRIVGRLEAGHSHIQICREFNLTPSVLFNSRKQFQITGFVERKPGCYDSWGIKVYYEESLEGIGRKAYTKSIGPFRKRECLKPDPAHQTTAPGICPSSPEEEQVKQGKSRDRYRNTLPPAQRSYHPDDRF